MKTFIFILYVALILIIPQLYTFLVRVSSDNDDAQAFIVFFGGGFTLLLIISFTIALINWDILSINL